MNESEQTKRLRKYEAPERVICSSDGPPQMDFLSPFGPLIARTRVPEFLIDHLNSVADETLTDGEGAEFTLAEDDVRLGGDDSLLNMMTREVVRFVNQAEGPQGIPDVGFDVFWIVSQYRSTPSPVHFHSGDISGVLYLKVPHVNSGDEDRNYINGRKAGYINFLSGGKQRFSHSLISFEPQVGDLYIFPGWLLHGAEPFEGIGERRSLAFNAIVR